VSQLAALFADSVPNILGVGSAGISHCALFGTSGVGKSQLLINICRHRLANPAWGLHVVDVEGDVTPACIEAVANPAYRFPRRVLHVLRSCSATQAFALPLLRVEKVNPLDCCRVAVRALSVFHQAVGFGMDDVGPRLAKLFTLGCFGLALSDRPLIDLPDLYGHGVSAAALRAVIGDAFPYQFLSDEMRSLDVLHGRTFLEYRDALISRLMPIFSNPILRRIFGPQRPPLDLAGIMRRRECVFLDLSGLEHRDSVLVGTAYVSLIFHHGLLRAPNVEPYTTLLIDEAFDYLTADLCRGLDRLRKRNIQLCLAVQRLGQFQ
jgi:hypothetical protein